MARIMRHGSQCFSLNPAQPLLLGHGGICEEMDFVCDEERVSNDNWSYQSADHLYDFEPIGSLGNGRSLRAAVHVTEVSMPPSK